MGAILLSILSGLLLTAGFPKPAMFYLSWVAFIPLLYAIQSKNGKQAFCAWLYLRNSCTVRPAFSGYITLFIIIAVFLLRFPILVLLLLCCTQGSIRLCSPWWRKMGKIPVLYVFGLPFAWVALEWARAHAISGFPWSNLGYTQTPLNQLVQVADITGVYGLSWLVVLGNTVIYGFIRNFFRRSGAAVLAVCIVSALLYGFWRTETINALQNTAPLLNVAVVQGNIVQNEKWDPAFESETIRRYGLFSMDSVKNAPVPDILVWPESAMPFFYGLDEELSPGG